MPLFSRQLLLLDLTATALCVLRLQIITAVLLKEMERKVCIKVMVISIFGIKNGKWGFTRKVRLHRQCCLVLFMRFVDKSKY